MNDTKLPRRSTIGLWLFGVYLAFYSAFVAISAFAGHWFEVTLFGGLTLAVVYGFGLIVLALLLALVYGALRRT